MALPKEPRQKMINLMYLVLTALLALNVSSEILNAFKVVNNSLITSNNAIESKNQTLFQSFQDKLNKAESKEKAEIWWPKAKAAKELSEQMFAYLEDLKKKLIKESKPTVVDGVETFAEDNLDAATRVFVEGPEGKELQKKLEEYKRQILAIDPKITQEFGKSLPLNTDIPKVTNSQAGQKDWAYAYFHMTPTMAAITILSKFQNDIKNTESQVVEFCHKEIGQVEVIYDQFKAIASGNATYLMPGEEMTITAGIGAFSSAAKPLITVDGGAATTQPDGSSEYKFKVGGPGAYQKTVKIVYTGQDGKQAIVDKVIKYTVGVPSGLNISTDKTRVFYQDLENPLSVTGGGGDEKVSVNIQGPGVSLSKVGAGQYIVRCPELGMATVVASDGKGPATQVNIPIKKVPSPMPMVGNLIPGEVAYNRFKAQRGVFAELKDFVFEGIAYKVTDFVVIASGEGFREVGYADAEVHGTNAFTPEVLDILKKCQSGSNVTIDNIYVVGPGGKKRKIDGNITYVLTD